SARALLAAASATVATVATPASLGLDVAFGLLEQLLAAEPDAAVAIDVRDDDLDLVAELHDVVDLVEYVARHRRDVAEPVGGLGDLDGRAVALHATHAALVLLVDLGLGGEALDDGDGLLHRLAVRWGDAHGAVVGHVDLHARLVDDGLD